MSKRNGQLHPHVPQDPDAERATLGSMLLERDAIGEVASVLRDTGGAAFSRESHQHLYEVLVHLLRTDQPIDGELIRNELTRRGVWQKVGGYDLLAGLIGAVPSAARAQHYARLVLTAYLRGQYAGLGHTLTTQAADPGIDIGELVARHRDTLERLAKGAPAPEPRFHFHTAGEFDNLDLRRDYHVPGILAAGPVPTVLAGSFKTLKTSIACDLLFSLASGTKFLGHFPTTQTNVVLMSGESGGFALQNILRRVANARGCALADVAGRLRIATAVPSLSCRQELDELERTVAEHGINVLAVDPTYLAMRGIRTDDAANLFAVGALLEPITRLAERTGCTPIVVHHTSRGATRASAGEPAELSDIAWSGFSEWAGQWVLLSRREKYDPDSNGEHQLWLTAGGRDGHSTLVGVRVIEGRAEDFGGRRWEANVEQASRVRTEQASAAQAQRDQIRKMQREARLESDTRLILDKMNTCPQGATKRNIRDRCGLRTERFDEAFAPLVAAGTLAECTIAGGNNRTYTGYKIAAGRNGTQRDVPLRPSAEQRSGTPLYIEGVPSRCTRPTAEPYPDAVCPVAEVPV